MSFRNGSQARTPLWCWIVVLALCGISLPGANSVSGQSHDELAKPISDQFNTFDGKQLSVDINPIRPTKVQQDAGSVTLDFLLDAQRRLADAGVAYYESMVQFNSAIKEYHFRKGTLLDEYGIEILPKSELKHHST